MSSDKRKRVHNNNDDLFDLDEVDPAIPSSSKRLKQASETTLLNLSDDVLLIIFTHLSTPGEKLILQKVYLYMILRKILAYTRVSLSVHSPSLVISTYWAFYPYKEVAQVWASLSTQCMNNKVCTDKFCTDSESDKGV
jgi:hypothetical protein